MHILASATCTSAVLWWLCVWVMYVHVVQMTSLMTGGLVVFLCVSFRYTRELDKAD